MTVLTMPEEMANAVKDSHVFEIDPPTGSRADRWTCTNCGDAVIAHGTTVYGAATKRACRQLRIEVPE
jgi:hypothetical protein